MITDAADDCSDFWLLEITRFPNMWPVGDISCGLRSLDTSPPRGCITPAVATAVSCRVELYAWGWLQGSSH